MATYSTDSRPRIKYILPDGRPIPVIHDHGQVPQPSIIFEVKMGDRLWDVAQSMPGSNRRSVVAILARGL